jgi:transcriptional regulator with XRE-family HTH domain
MIVFVNSISDRLRFAINERGLSVYAAGEKAGLKRGHLDNILKRGGSMTTDKLERLVRALNVSADWLLTGEGIMDRPAYLRSQEGGAQQVAASASELQGAALRTRGPNAGKGRAADT